MLTSEWLPLLEKCEDALLKSLDLNGYSLTKGGPFGNSLEYRLGAAWLVLEARHPQSKPFALRVPISDIFARSEHIDRLNFISEKMEDENITWFPGFEMKSFDFGPEPGVQPCPVMVMEWVEGEPLWRVLYQQRNNPKVLTDLLRQFSRLVDEMTSAGFDHGDISITNMRVMPNGMLMLLDPDSLTHEELHISRSVELGHPTWNHSQRSTEHTVDLHLIPVALIKCFIEALIHDPNLLSVEPDPEEFFYTEEDLQNPYQSQNFDRLMGAFGLSPSPKKGLHPLLDLMAALDGSFEDVSLWLCAPAREDKNPKVTIEYLLDTEIQPHKASRRNPNIRPIPRERKRWNASDFAREFNFFRKHSESTREE